MGNESEETIETARVPVDDGPVVVSRQVRRAEERAATKQSAALAALATMAENAERVVVGEEQAGKLQKMRQMLFALIRREGRVRLSRADLAAVALKDGLDAKVQENGDLVVTYLKGSQR